MGNVLTVTLTYDIMIMKSNERKVPHMTTIERNEYGYEIKADTYTMTIPHHDMSLLVNIYMKNSLRDSIIYELHEADGDTIDLERYPHGFDELVDEIFMDLEDEVDYGNLPTDDDIKDKIADVANYYEMELE